jgi:hypothetical protein
MRFAPHRSNKILIPALGLEFCLSKICGGKGIRTPDLLIANETLYQLSYTPEKSKTISWEEKISATILGVKQSGFAVSRLQFTIGAA